MMLKHLNINLLTKFLTQQLEQVTCFECCKCYSTPVTAECGHTLCNGCWYGRRKCPLCALAVERKILKLNLPLQSLTDHVHDLIQSFEKLFNIKLAELELETTSKELHETDTNKNVTDWLENSQNKFSAPISNISTQDLNPQVEYLTSKAQIHTLNAKPIYQAKKDSIQHCQVDWDKIEILEDIEDNVKNKENVEHIDLMETEENEYTSENPRRSTRKKEISTIGEPEEVHNEKTNSTKSIIEVSKQPTKMKQTWNHAKKMRQEFSKFNKENRNKLKVSIETVETAVERISETKLQEDNLTTNIAGKITAQESSEVSEQEKNTPDTNNPAPDLISNGHNSKKTNVCDSTDQTPLSVQNKINTSMDSGNPCDNEVMSPKVKFLKKGLLHVKPNKISQKSDKEQIKKTDNVVITIRVGKLVTNVCIQQDEIDPQVKIHVDRQIQTSFGSKNISILSENTSNNLKTTKVQSTQINNINSNIQSKIITNGAQSRMDILKSDSTKKNTASADTKTAQFDITNSDKELPGTMELPVNRQKTKSQNEDKQNQSPQEKILEDLFECEFSETPSVKSMKTSKNVPSAILVPTQNISKTYTPVEKRLRNLDYDELPLKKKQRLNTEKVTLRGGSKAPCYDSESGNYDTVLEKVFANIDADIGITQNSNRPCAQHISNKTNIIKNTQVASQCQNFNTNKHFDNEKDSENLFSNCENDVIIQSNKLNTQAKPVLSESLTPNLYQELTSAEDNREDDMDIELGTPLNDGSDVSIVEETPQKNVSNIKVKQKSGISNFDNDTSQQSNTPTIEKTTLKNINASNVGNDTFKKIENTDLKNVKNSIITPLTINKFVEQIQHKSTPVARKSLNFNIKNIKPDADETLCKSSNTEQETTQEREFRNEVFQEAITSPEFECRGSRDRNRKVEFCIAGSCLKPKQTYKLRQLCEDKGWRFVEEYVKDLTHLVIEVDEDNKCKRSLKYMQALAAGKWIVGFAWVEKCMQNGATVPEEGFECVDMTGEPGPRRSRLARRKLFSGIAFYCMPPITMLDDDMLKEIIVSAGGTLVSEASEVRVAGGAPGFVLADPDSTQDAKYEYLAMDVGIVPVHCEWALNCLGRYALEPLEVPLLLCSPTVLKPKVAHWPQELRALIE